MFGERFGRGDGAAALVFRLAGTTRADRYESIPRARQHVVAHSRHSCIVRCNGTNTATVPLDRGRASMRSPIQILQWNDLIYQDLGPI